MKMKAKTGGDMTGAESDNRVGSKLQVGTLDYQVAAVPGAGARRWEDDDDEGGRGISGKYECWDATNQLKIGDRTVWDWGRSPTVQSMRSGLVDPMDIGTSTVVCPYAWKGGRERVGSVVKGSRKN